MCQYRGEWLKDDNGDGNTGHENERALHHRDLDMEDPTIPTTDAWEEAAYGTPRSAAMRPNLGNAVRETWWLDFVKWKR